MSKWYPVYFDYFAVDAETCEERLNKNYLWPLGTVIDDFRMVLEENIQPKERFKLSQRDYVVSVHDEEYGTFEVWEFADYKVLVVKFKNRDDALRAKMMYNYLLTEPRPKAAKKPRWLQDG